MEQLYKSKPIKLWNRLEFLCTHTYNDSSVMCGACSGVQALLSAEVPQVIYTQCMNHWLNLINMAACKNSGGGLF